MKTQVSNTIHKYGEAIELTPQGSDTTYYLTASVQVPLSDAVVNDYDLTAYIVYIAFDDLPQSPTKFDRLLVRGRLRGINEVQVETLSGTELVYILRIQG